MQKNLVLFGFITIIINESLFFSSFVFIV